MERGKQEKEELVVEIEDVLVVLQPKKRDEIYNLILLAGTKRSIQEVSN